MSSRFSTYWFNPEDAITGLEEQLGQAETECDILREFVEEARLLLAEAKFDDAGSHYDTLHWLADVDLHLEEPS